MTDVVLPRRRRSWLATGLVASLAVNAFLIGAVATDLMRPPEPVKIRPVHFELRWLQGRLPQKEFDMVAGAIAAARPEAEQHAEKLRSLRAELATLAAEPSPDRAAIDNKLAEIRTELSLMVADVQDTAISALLTLPADTRAGLARAAATDKPQAK